MKNWKKVGAALIAAMAMAVNTGSMLTSAEEVMPLSTSETYYYPAYDFYTTQAVSPTTHYIGVMANDVTSLSSIYVYLYLNMNIFDSSYANISRVTIGDVFSACYTANTLITENYSTSVRRLKVRLDYDSTAEPELSNYEEMFSYCLGTIAENDAVFSESDLLKFTSESINAPSTTITTSDGSLALKKCIYSLGDTNRDGTITTADTELIMGYLTKLASAATGRSVDEAVLDQLAFEMAADFDSDGDVDLQDIIALNQYIVGSNN